MEPHEKPQTSKPEVCATQPARVRIGFAGWCYPDWNGIFYPKPRPRGFKELAYVARFFDVAEINSSFYRPMKAAWVRNWLAQVEANPDFIFTAKLWRGFTHDRNAGREAEAEFKEGLAPLIERNRLGALLLQFPWSFKNKQENLDYLAGLIGRFRDYPLVVEVRHASWNDPDVFDWLRGERVGICNIDQPRIGRSLGPSACTTSHVGYVRVHGRNAEHWFEKDRSPIERYDYLYSLNELAPWVERIKEIAGRAEVVYVIANNHPEGKSAVNAFQLRNLLSGNRVSAPESLIRKYPQLEAIAEANIPESSEWSLRF